MDDNKNETRIIVKFAYRNCTHSVLNMGVHPKPLAIRSFLGDWIAIDIDRLLSASLISAAEGQDEHWAHWTEAGRKLMISSHGKG